ncbi:PaaI family thioesterase [Streptomyces massasporeus]|uniref:PaaI family thioesterase n=1 Tax=Streptomyces massasporeus TaxID=67324 RepID=A0ABW6LMC6_9ACTN
MSLFLPRPSAPSALTPREHARLDNAPHACTPGAVERRFGVLGCRVQDGFLRTVMRTGPWMDGSDGHQAGALAVLLDHSMAETIYNAAGPGRWSLTTRLAYDIVAPAPWRTAALYATSWVPRSDRSGGFAQCEVTDERGELVAVGSTWVQNVAASGPLHPVADAASEDTGGSGAANFTDHLGARLTVEGEDTRAELPRAEPWNNGYGTLHGGVWAGLAELAGSAALAHHGRDLRTATVSVSYLRRTVRPSVAAVARPAHLGQSFGVVEVTGTDNSGRQCVSATVTGRHHAR